MSAPSVGGIAGATVVVIGGSSGIGAEVARLAVGQNARVVVTGRDPGRLAAAASQIGVDAAVLLDAHDDGAVAAFFADLGEQHAGASGAGTGVVDHLVSMVGDSMAGGFLTTSAATMRHVLASKFWANWTIAREAAAAGVLRGGGSVTFTAGTGGRPHEISASYVANLGLGALVEGLAVELGPRVRVNAVAPTFMVTPFWKDVPPADLEATRREIVTHIPLGRLGTVAEVAAAYLHLMVNGFVTGQVLAVDGGVMLGA